MPAGATPVFPDWLRAEGCELPEEESPCGILYFTRHYKLRDGPGRAGARRHARRRRSGLLKFGVFPADNRHFSVTLATPEIETGLRTAIIKPEVFEAICDALPGCARWTDAGARRTGQPRLCHGQSRKCVAALSEGRRAAGARLLCAGRCGRAHQSALRPRLLVGHGAGAYPARGAGRDHAIRSNARKIVARETWDGDPALFRFHGEAGSAGHPPRRERARSRLQAAAEGEADEELRRGCADAGLARRPDGRPRHEPRVPHGRPSHRLAERPGDPGAAVVDVGDAEIASSRRAGSIRRNSGPSAPRCWRGWA